MIELEKYRNENGYIDLDKIEDLWMEIQPVGVSESYWLTIPWLEDFRVMFKRPIAKIAKDASVNDDIPYEFISSLVTAEIAKSLGIPAAEYDIAIYNGMPGVITKNFLGKGEVLVSGHNVVRAAKREDPIKFQVIKTNPFEPEVNIKNIEAAFKVHLGDDAKASKLFKNWLQNIYMMDFLMTELDRSSFNWSLIYDGQEYSLAPRYDNDHIACAYLGKERLIKFIEEVKEKGYEAVVKYIYKDDKLATLYSYDSLTMYDDFEIFCEENLDFAKESFEVMKKINLVKIYENVEARIKRKIPDDYKLWVGIVIGYQMEFIKRTIERKEEITNGKNSYTQMEEFGSRDAVQR